MPKTSSSTTPSSSHNRRNRRVSRSQTSPAIKRRSIAKSRRKLRMPQTMADSVPVNRHTFSQYDADIDELQEHIIMAIDKTSNGRIGCAYYVARHELLCCMHDLDNADAGVIEALTVDIEPTVMLCSPRTNDAAVVSNRASSLISCDTDDRPMPYEVVVRPAPDFKHENAISKLENLNTLTQNDCIRFLIPGENINYDEIQSADELGHVNQQGRLFANTSSMDMNNRLSVGCVGAILSYLQRRRASEHLQRDPEADAAYRISTIEMFSLKDTMYASSLIWTLLMIDRMLSADTFSSLQIIQSESHPNIANQGPSSSGAKESLSVYGLFQRFARTPQGKARLRQMFHRPSLDAQVIVDRHGFISVLTKPENHAVLQSLSKSLNRIKNMQTVLTSLRKGIERSQNSGTIRSGVWAALLEFCYHCIDVSDASREIAGADNLHLFASIGDMLARPELQRIGKMVHDIVDLDESLEQHRTVIKHGIQDELDRVKDAYDGMEEVLARVATSITNEMPPHIEQRLNVVFLPQLGFHVTVPMNEAHEPIWTGDGLWDRRFRTEKYQYFKNNKMREMDEQWGDLYAVICDTEIEISHNLAQRVLDSQAWLIRASNYCGELDCLLALAHGALQYKLVRPKMVQESIVDITGGRHILQEMTVASYVPNDTMLASGDKVGLAGHPSMILLTGPNYSGKSVYMKQVALIVYMAQIGSFVPADGAVLGITDKIITRINTAETVSKTQSAFLIDLQQISKALKSFTNQSLLVIDEFGKGTDNCDGAGLASAVFQYLLNLGTESPKVLASTHFHEMFEQNDFSGYNNNLKLAHMQVHLPDPQQGAYQQVDRLAYLYTLCKGRSDVSYGTQCAILNGISNRIVERANLLTGMVTRGEDLVATCAALPQAELQELEEAQEICREFLEWNLDDERLDMDSMLNRVGVQQSE